LEIGKPPGAAPGKAVLETLLHRLVRGYKWKLVRLPGVAPGHPRGGETFWLLNHSRKEVKGPGHQLPAHAFQQRTNTSCYLCDTNPRFSRWFFRCLGHTSCEALKM